MNILDNDRHGIDVNFYSQIFNKSQAIQIQWSYWALNDRNIRHKGKQSCDLDLFYSVPLLLFQIPKIKLKDV